MSKPGLAFSKIPKWATLLLILGVASVCLAVVVVFRDLEREKTVLRDLYLQKGEMLIRMLDMAHGFGWLKSFDSERLTTTREEISKRDETSFSLLFLLATRYDGTPVAASENLDAFDPEDFANPEPVSSFHPEWVSFGRDMRLLDGQMVFVVYRPRLSAVSDPPSHRPDRAHSHPDGAPDGAPDESFDQPPGDSLDASPDGPPEDAYGETPSDSLEGASGETAAADPGERPFLRKPKHKRPTWPPDIDLEKANDRALYLWVGFDYGQFEVAARAGLINAIIFTLLIGLVLVAGVLYFTRSTRFIRSYAMTNEIIKRLPVGLLFSDQENRLSIANQEALRIMGLGRESVLGKSLEELTGGAFPAERELTAAERDLVFAGGKSPRLSISTGPVMDPKGDEVGRVILMADLAEIDKLREEVAKNSRLARLGGLASGLAHNIRNPVGSIKALAQHLLDRGTDPSVREPLGIILGGVDRLNRTLDDFLDFAFPEVKLEPVDILKAVKQCHVKAVARANTTGSRTAIELKAPEGSLFFSGDEERLITALDCLYLNAAEAVEDKAAGRLVVTVSAIRKGLCQIKLVDNGSGFSRKQLQTPFVPYSTTKPDRVGLGLAKANNIIEAFQGTLALANSPEGGALVTLRLPLIEGEPSQLKKDTVDLRQLLTRAHNRANLEKDTRNVDLTLETPETPVAIEASPQRLEDALVKLYLAAAAASADNPPGRPRTLTASLAPSASGGAEISLVYNGSRLTEDNPAFDPVFSGPDSAKAIIEAHGGTLTMERASGGEGLILVTLPKTPM